MKLYDIVIGALILISATGAFYYSRKITKSSVRKR